ncbi:MAG: hypothetical protein ACRD1T_13575, partial [Acidimicrobiia bacterium]
IRSSMAPRGPSGPGSEKSAYRLSWTAAIQGRDAEDAQMIGDPFHHHEWVGLDHSHQGGLRAIAKNQELVDETYDFGVVEGDLVFGIDLVDEGRFDLHLGHA